MLFRISAKIPLMQAIEGLNETHLRPDKRQHPLVEEWVMWRQMYMRNAPYAAVPRWISWPLRFMRQGDIGGLGMALNHMYAPGVPKELKLTAHQIDAMYRECFKRAVPYFLNAAEETAPVGNVSKTRRLLENARICAAAVDVEFNQEAAVTLTKTSMEVALPKTLDLLNTEAHRETDFDYWYVALLYKEARSWAGQLGVDVTRQTNLAEHRLTFKRPH